MQRIARRFILFSASATTRLLSYSLWNQRARISCRRRMLLTRSHTDPSVRIDRSSGNGAALIFLSGFGAVLGRFKSCYAGLPNVEIVEGYHWASLDFYARIHLTPERSSGFTHPCVVRVAGDELGLGRMPVVGETRSATDYRFRPTTWKNGPIIKNTGRNNLTPASPLYNLANKAR